MVIFKNPTASLKMGAERLSIGSHGDFYPWIADWPLDVSPLETGSLIQGTTFYERLSWKGVTHMHADGEILNTPILDGYGNAYDFLRASYPNRESREDHYSYGFTRIDSTHVVAPIGVPCIYLRLSSSDNWRTSTDLAVIEFVYSWREPRDGRVCVLATSIVYRYDYDKYAGFRDPYSRSYTQNASYGIPFITDGDLPPMTKKRPLDVSSDARFLVDYLLERYGPNGTLLDLASRPTRGELNFRTDAQYDPTNKRFLDYYSVKSLCRHLQFRILYEANLAFPKFRPELDANAFDKLQAFDGNLGLLASKIAAAPLGSTTINSVIDLFKGNGGVKDLASYWLANRYGDRLGFSGFKDLIESLEKELGSIRYLIPQPKLCRSHTFGTIPGFTGDVRYAVTLAVEPEDVVPFQKLVRKLMEWDAYPSLQNVWDAIPLSFVVDWFVNVGDIFQSIDRMVQSRYYRIESIMESYRAQLHTRLLPELTFVVYERRDGGSLHLGVSSVELGLPSAINCISGAALLCG